MTDDNDDRPTLESLLPWTAADAEEPVVTYEYVPWVETYATPDAEQVIHDAAMSTWGTSWEVAGRA